ncbi:DUF7266 family protein [Halorientalis marina]|jgi:hypothetical protein|uniref:DUF7266 family protein n=1 Tax=Halorientalis marina TaxID=2931976 RepID=UPI001FF1F323|nr:hypothetical protein [Halorientalis marina]
MWLRDDSRGASIPLTHALSLGITALLIAGLLLGSGQLLDRQTERVTEKGLADVSEGVTNEITRIDRLATTDGNTDADLSSRVTFPARIAGEGYDITLRERSGTAVLYANASGLSRQVQLSLDSDVCPRSINGGPIRIVYDNSDDCISLQPTSR